MPTYRRSFISHAHADNVLCDPYATEMARLGAPHYYDRANPQIGHDIGEALERELQQAQALIVLASPHSLASPWVREEIAIFFTLMMKEPSRILIPVKIAPCDLPPRLEARWWVNGLGRAAGDVVAELAQALEVSMTAAPWPGAAQTPAPTPVLAPTPTAPPAASYSRVVDWRHGMGDHTTITAAIAAARPGERILVRKGLYEGPLNITQPMEIVGDGQPGDVEVHASGQNTIEFTATQGRVANLTVRQTGGGGGTWSGVNIMSGRMDLEDCDVSSQGGSGVAIHDGADPRIRRCHAHDGIGCGIHVYDQARGLIEDCDIFANRKTGIEIKTGARPTVRKCRISRNTYDAFYIHDDGGGVFEDNDIRGNGTGPWDISNDSKANVTRRGNIE